MAPPPILPREGGGTPSALASTIRGIMSTHVGVLRDGAGLQAAVDKLTPLAQSSDMALAGLLIATAALRREESRGAQARTDFPAPDSVTRRSTLALRDLEISEPSLRRAAGL